MRNFAVQAARKNGFDFERDYPLIVASFASAYGLRIRSPATHIPWPEFTALLAGLPCNTPLPQMITIRQTTEKEAEQLNTAAQQARVDWQIWLAEQSAAASDLTAAVEHVFQSFFGGQAKTIDS